MIIHGRIFATQLRMNNDNTDVRTWYNICNAWFLDTVLEYQLLVVVTMIIIPTPL